MIHAATSVHARWLTLVVLAASCPGGRADTPAATAAPKATADTAARAPARSPVPGDSASYNLGLVFGYQLNNSGLSKGVSMDALTRGIQDGLKGRQPTQQAKQQAGQTIMDARQALAEHNKALAHKFLAENGKRAGVVTTASGLQYTILNPGDPTAKKPDDHSRVTVAYRGTLLDGTEFDTSAAHGQAAIFRMNSIIPGWKEALRLMAPGARWRLFVPPELAYDNHSPPGIPPGSLVTYVLDLVSVNASDELSSQGRAGVRNPVPASHTLESAKP